MLLAGGRTSNTSGISDPDERTHTFYSIYKYLWTKQADFQSDWWSYAFFTTLHPYIFPPLFIPYFIFFSSAFGIISVASRCTLYADETDHDTILPTFSSTIYINTTNLFCFNTNSHNHFNLFSNLLLFIGQLNFHPVADFSFQSGLWWNRWEKE